MHSMFNGNPQAKTIGEQRIALINPVYSELAGWLAGWLGHFGIS